MKPSQLAEHLAESGVDLASVMQIGRATVIEANRTVQDVRTHTQQMDTLTAHLNEHTASKRTEQTRYFAQRLALKENRK